jgi:general secretion pathway protein J
MAMRFWLPGSAAVTSAAAGGWRAAAGVSTAASGSAGPASPNTASLPTGLEVALTQRGQQVPLIKSFLLGAL